MAINPYLKKQKDVQTAYIDPKTGNLSIVGGGGGDATDYLRSRGDEFTSKGYATITDPNVIKQLQEGVSKTSSFKSPEEWQNYFKQTGASFTAPTSEEMQSANQRLEQYKQYKDYAKPVSNTTQNLNQSPTNNNQSNSSITTNSNFNDRNTIEQGIQNAQRQRALESLNNAFNTTKARLEQERQIAEQQARTQEGQIRTRDEMARMATDKLLGTRGLGTSGQVGQSDIAQNVITQGAQSALSSDLANQKADIQRRLSEAEMLRQQGITDFETEQSILQLQNRLNQINQQEERQYQQDLLNQQYAREDALRAEEQTRINQDIERQNFINTIGRFGQDYAAEINRVSNDGDPSNDWQIPLLQQARQQKIAGIESSKAEQSQLQSERDFEIYKIQLEAEIDDALANGEFERARILNQEKAEANRRLEAVKQANDMAQIQARGAEDRATAQFRSDLEPIATEQAGAKYDDKTIDASIANAVARAKAQAVTTDQFGRQTGTYTPTDEANTIALWIAQNADDLSEEQGNALVRRYNLDINEIRRLMQ